LINTCEISVFIFGPGVRGLCKVRSTKRSGEEETDCIFVSRNVATMLEERVPLTMQGEGRRATRSRPLIFGGIAAFAFVLLVVVGISVMSTKNQTPDTQTNSAHNAEPTSDLLIGGGNFSIMANYKIPCVYNAAKPAGCATDRVRTVTCGAINTNGFPTLTISDETACGNNIPKLQQTINVQFYQNPGTSNCLEITAQFGECWGVNPINGGDYGCQGQCGAGCINGCGLFSLGGAWARNCLRHDICSWYFGASGGGSSPQCGKSYDQAAKDLLSCECKLSGHTCNF